MPELGGRIYAAMDKRTGYDFFYRQHVVKPALIGLLGSWISGGLEFNWPCHHRAQHLHARGRAGGGGGKRRRYGVDERKRAAEPHEGHGGRYACAPEKHGSIPG